MSNIRFINEDLSLKSHDPTKLNGILNDKLRHLSQKGLAAVKQVMDRGFLFTYERRIKQLFQWKVNWEI